MLNLLTLEEKRSIKREYRVRVAAVIAAGLFFVSVFAIAGLLPAYFHVTVNLKIKNTDLENLAVSSEREGDDSVALALKSTDTILSFIGNKDNDEKLATVLIQDTLKVRPSGVRVTTLSFDVSEGNKIITVRGIADTRASLIEFSRNLGNQPGFLAANVPAEDLAQATNIDFRLTVRGDF
jgi:hypothetical protein